MGVALCPSHLPLDRCSIREYVKGNSPWGFDRRVRGLLGGPVFNLELPVRTCVYVDGFNLYYGTLKDTRHKWLDLFALFQSLLKPHHQILRIKYFTARVSGTSRDPAKARRQHVYLRALQHYRPEVEIHLGHFLSHNVRLPLATPTARQRTAEVIKTEEKASDVNLAVHLLNDCWLDAYDCALVVTNDSDIAEAMRLVKQHHRKLIGLATPGSRHPSRQLLAHADFSLHIRNKRMLQRSQLPDPIPGTTIHKPVAW